MYEKSITVKGKKYKYTPSDRFDPDILDMREVYNTGFIKIAVSFDIETTSFYSDKYKKDIATMYVWQLGIDNYTIIGRTWSEFVRVIDIISEWAGKLKGVVLCLIHNFSFEFSFLKGILNWRINESTGLPDMFAKDDRNILYAKYGNIEFRDSLALTDMGLGRLQKNYNLSIGKLEGDLDYKKYRHSGTPLTNTEISYCINDVQVLNDFYYKYLVPEFLEKDKRIPLTATGLVRQDIREEFNKLDKSERRKLQNRIRNAQPTEDIYKVWRNWLFRGGYVHANTIACNYLIDGSGDFKGKDLKSAHPAAMLLRSFPWKFNRRNKNAFNEVLSQARTGKYAFWGIFKFYNIRSKTYHSLESRNKIIEENNAIYENGRLIKADPGYIKVALCDIDYYNYELMYEWGSIECTCLYQARYEPLPDYLRKTVMKYYVLKETLDKSTPEYSDSKRRLNSCFGCCATSLPERSLVFSKSDNNFVLSTDIKGYDDLVRYLLLLPQWAIYIAAWSRNSIVRSITEDGLTDNYGIDSVYYDTDSNKVRNYSKHSWWFDKFNNEMREKVDKMEVYDYDRSLFYKIGSFDTEYDNITRIKVLGAKRYLLESDGEVKCTVAGMVKGSLEEYCKKKNKNIWDMFTDKLTLDPKYSKKITSIYTDTAIEDVLVDYKGVPAVVKESSCVALIEIPFTMSMEVEFMNRIKSLEKDRERMIFKGVW